MAENNEDLNDNLNNGDNNNGNNDDVVQINSHNPQQGQIAQRYSDFPIPIRLAVGACALYWLVRSGKIEKALAWTIGTSINLGLNKDSLKDLQEEKILYVLDKFFVRASDFFEYRASRNDELENSAATKKLCAEDTESATYKSLIFKDKLANCALDAPAFVAYQLYCGGKGLVHDSKLEWNRIEGDGSEGKLSFMDKLATFTNNGLNYGAEICSGAKAKICDGIGGLSGELGKAYNAIANGFKCESTGYSPWSENAAEDSSEDLIIEKLYALSFAENGYIDFGI